MTEDVQLMSRYLSKRYKPSYNIEILKKKLDHLADTHDMRKDVLTRHFCSVIGQSSYHAPELSDQNQNRHEEFSKTNEDYPASVVFDNHNQVLDVLGSADSSVWLHMECSKALYEAGGTVVVYITGHGLSREASENIKSSAESINVQTYELSSSASSDGENSETQSDEIEDDIPDWIKLIGPGQILAYKTLLTPDDFLNEFRKTCYYRALDHDFDGRKPASHIVLLVDCCYSGYWIDWLRSDARVCYSFKEYIGDTDISITIQTACDRSSNSHGYYFAPLFIQLQTLTTKELDDLISQYRQLTEQEQKYLDEKTIIQQSPLFCSIHMNEKTIRKPMELKIGNEKFVFELHNLRFFTHGLFFKYFADKFRHLTFPLDIDNDDNHVFLPLYRPILHPHPQNMDRILRASIRGILLKTDSYSKPLCIALINPRLTFEATDDNGFYQPFDNRTRSFYHLHIHFNGADPYPGVITHPKLLYAEQYYDRNDNEVSEEVENSRNLTTKAYEMYKQYNNDHPNNPLHLSEKYIPGWQPYERQLREKLERSAEQYWRTLGNTDNIWNNESRWIRQAKLGNVFINNARERSRSILTTKLTSKPEEFIKKVVKQREIVEKVENDLKSDTDNMTLMN